MTVHEVKEILRLHRPDAAAEADPRLAEALRWLEQDAELARWYADERALHTHIRQKLRGIRPPDQLKAQILARAKIIQPQVPEWWRSPAWAAVAAVFLIVAIFGAYSLRPRLTNQFANFRARMVGTALREYRMDIVTNDMREVRQYLASRGAPADYRVPQGLEKLQLTGGGFLTWRNNPVSMVCFDSGKGKMVFLFIMPRSAVKDPPAGQPVLATSHDLLTVSWSDASSVYMLAGPEDSDVQRRVF